MGLRKPTPAYFLLKPFVRDLFLKGPDPHGEGAEPQDGGGMAKAWVGRGRGASELSRSSLQPVVGNPGLWPVVCRGLGVWGSGG